MLRKLPLIVILGSTGTGKTKLSIQLAQKFNGEIISADSMQVYADLDVVTAKATKEEQQIVPHHMLNIVKPSEPFTVTHFRNLALPIIDDLIARSKCPIVVGGTNYYIESLLWEILFNSTPTKDTLLHSKLKDDTLFGEIGTKTPETMIQHKDETEDLSISTPSDSSDGSDLELETMSPQQLHNRLRQVDPISAGRLHPNNKRKILRALEVYQETGVPISELIKEQRSRPGANRLGGPLRYPHVILLWLRCDQETLNCRLNKRVDSMLETGLLSEVRNFYETYVKSKSENEYTKGILQSIGFKEFSPYLEKFGAEQDEVISGYLRTIAYELPEKPTPLEPQGLDLLRKCLDELKLVTRRYSKKQMKWIKNRFLGSDDRQVPSIYSLDTSDVGQWQSNVYWPAIDIIESYMNEIPSKRRPMDRVQHPGSGLNEEVLNFCEICNRHFVGEFQWKSHLASNKHKRAKDGRNKRKKRLGTKASDENDGDDDDGSCSGEANTAGDDK